MTQENEETEQLVVNVPADAKEAAKEKLEHGGLTRVVREKLSEVAYGAESSEKERLQHRLDDLRDTRQEKKNERAQLDREIDEINRKIERVEERLDTLRDKAGEYEGALQMIEDLMHEDGMIVDPGNGKVQRAAEVSDCSASDVIADLKERNPELEQSHFQEEEPDANGGIDRRHR